VQRSLARAAFFGLLSASAGVALVDAVVLLVGPGDASATTRLLAALYASAPFVAFGAVAAATAGFLTALWTRARPRSAPDLPENEPTADGPAGLVALVFFAATCFVAAFLVATRTHHRGLGATALALFAPLALGASFYLWSVLRRLLGALDARWGGGRITPSRALGAGVLAFVLSLGIATFLKNDALQESFGAWPPVVLFSWPVVAAATTMVLYRRAHTGLRHPAWARSAVVAAALALVGTGDLVRFMEARPAVKAALLDQTLLFKPLVMQAQPFFDADRDGFAGLLGGGDCDDDNADVHPGAPELPLNGVDDDCYGGDAPGSSEPAAVAEAADPTDGPPRPALVHRPNVVLVTIDTLRADRLGAWGYPRGTSPRLDALAASGLRFHWAFAQGAQTKVSMPSVFTGRYFSEVDRSPDSWATIWPENITLAERLRDAGYHTAGFPAHRFFLPSYGLNQGFIDWDLTLVNKYGPRMVNVSTSGPTTDLTLEWLGRHAPDGGPYYLWIHYFDPHHYYQSHDLPTDLGDSDSDRYDEEIRFMDEHLGRLLDTLEERGWGRNTYVVVHGDHGEGFGEHDYRYHGQHLFNDQVRVPLIIAGPGLSGRVVETPVALLDIVPTVLDLVGLRRGPDLPGVSLLPFGTPRGTVNRGPVFIEMVRDSNHSDRRAIVDWPWKYQWGITFDEYTLFNLAEDPDEKRDLAEAEPEIRARLNARLRQWMAREVRPVTPRQ
jgi:arylsulfatase A-like enzyme